MPYSVDHFLLKNHGIQSERQAFWNSKISPAIWLPTAHLKIMSIGKPLRICASKRYVRMKHQLSLEIRFQRIRRDANTRFGDSTLGRTL